MTHSPISDAALDQLFRAARTQNGWLSTPVSDAQLHALYDLAKWGPTSVNQQPLRIRFLRSAEAKDKLKPLLMEGNRDKTMQAPVTAILGYDLEFFRNYPRIFPHAPGVRDWFDGKPDNALANARLNGILQGGYFILAARALGLDCGPMTGFDAAGVDAAFWAGTAVKTSMIVNIGHGDPAKVFPRSPRLDFDEVCTIL